jgi:hypothetical protein
VEFESYSSLNLFCNSIPPAISSAEVVYDSGEYVILFDTPDSARLKDDAADIKYFYANSAKVPVSVDSANGTISGLTEFDSSAGYASLSSSSAYKFVYRTGLGASSGVTNFDIGWMDSYNLKSAAKNIAVSLQSPSLYFDGNLLGDTDILAVNLGETEATVTAVSNLSGATVKYTVDGGTERSGNSFVLTTGTHSVEIWAEKSGYTDSAKKTYSLTVKQALKSPVLKYAGETLSNASTKTVNLTMDETGATFNLSCDESGVTFVCTDNSSAVTVSSDGSFTLGAGSHAVTVKAQKSGFEDSAEVTYTITVNSAELSKPVLYYDGSEISATKQISLTAAQTSATLTIMYPDSSVSGVTFVCTDNNSSVTVNSANEITLSSGTHSVVVTAQKSGCSDSEGAKYEIIVGAAVLEKAVLSYGSTTFDEKSSSNKIVLGADETSATLKISYPDANLSVSYQVGGTGVNYTVGSSSFDLSAGNYSVTITTLKDGCTSSTVTYSIDVVSTLKSPVIKYNSAEIASKKEIDLASGEADAVFSVEYPDSSVSGVNFVCTDGYGGTISLSNDSFTLGAGTHTVIAKSQKSGFEDSAEVTYTITVNSAELSEPVLTYNNGNDVTLSGTAKNEIDLSVGMTQVNIQITQAESAEISYELSGDRTDSGTSQNITLTRGTYTLTVTAAKDGFKSTSAEFIIVVKETLSAPNLTYGGNSFGSSKDLTLKSGETSAEFTAVYNNDSSNSAGVTFVYTIDGGTEQKGETVSVGSGEHKVTLKATKDGYNDSAEKTYTLNILRTFTIKYDANKPSGATGSVSNLQTDSSEVEEGKTFAISSTEPTLSGYRFTGYALNSSATTASYSAGDTISADDIKGDMTLYALWKKIYTITYNANKSGVTNPDSAEIEAGEEYTIPDSAKLSLSGSLFLGYATSSGATKASYSAGDEISVSGDMTLYGVWITASSSAISSYLSSADELTIDLNGGSLKVDNDMEVTSGKTLTIKNGTISVNTKNPLIVRSGGIINLDGVTIDGSNNTSSTIAAAVYSQGTVNMTNTDIKNVSANVSASAVYISSGGSVHMSGGTITNCTSTGVPVVYVGTGSFSMTNNATITGCSGSSVIKLNSNDNAVLRMTGGAITGNTGTTISGKGNVEADDDAVIDGDIDNDIDFI